MIEKDKDLKTYNELIEILMRYCGETGENEGAIETLKRKLHEIRALEEKIDGLKERIIPHIGYLVYRELKESDHSITIEECRERARSRVEKELGAEIDLKDMLVFLLGKAWGRGWFAHVRYPNGIKNEGYLDIKTEGIRDVMDKYVFDPKVRGKEDE